MNHRPPLGPQQRDIQYLERVRHTLLPEELERYSWLAGDYIMLAAIDHRKGCTLAESADCPGPLYQQRSLPL